MSRLHEAVICRPDWPVAQTVYGRVRGIWKEGTFIFLNLPYAKARRFHMAGEPDPWKGIRDANAFGCRSFVMKEQPPMDEHVVPHLYGVQSEHCQNLNIWTQHLDDGVVRPVLMWLHGGGFGGGNAMEQFAAGDGEELSRFGDVVIVSANIRLNCIGCLDLSSFGEEYRMSAYCGLSDLVMALRWIHDNIAHFGGDPGNVTLLSQSGAAPQAFALMQAPAADGLYHKVTAEGFMVHHLRVPEGMTQQQFAGYYGELVADRLGLRQSDIRQIETIPYSRLSAAAEYAGARIREEFGIRFTFDPAPDGRYLLPFTLSGGLRKETAQIPMLLGGDLGDTRSNAVTKLGDNLPHTWSEETVRKYLLQMYPKEGPAVMEAFQSAYPELPLYDVLYLDHKGRHQALELANQRAAQGSPVWNWLFTFEYPILDGITPFHCSTGPFITHNAESVPAAFLPGQTERLQDAMAAAWVAFAENGNPGCSALPSWDAVSPGSCPTMIFGDNISVRVNHDARLQELLAPYYPGEYYL